MTLAAFIRHLVLSGGLALVSAMVVMAMLSAGVIDRPAHRKAHTQPTPKGGGVGVVTAFLLGIAVLYSTASFARIADPYFLGVIVGAALIAAVSYADDLRDWPFTVKLGAQIGAALAVVGSGLWVRTFNVPNVGPVDVGWVGVAVTVGWIVFATNAMNFIDGMNGLCGGVALIACAFLAGIAQSAGGMFVYAASMLLAAGLVGFLPFNFPRARIFLGDVGSQFCGFMLAVLGVAAARFDRVELSFLLVPMLLSGALFDVAFTVARRLLSGHDITTRHRGHLFQIAYRAGMDPRWIVFIYWGFTVVGGLGCIGFVMAPSPLKPVLPFVVLLPELVWLGVVVLLARRARVGVW